MKKKNLYDILGKAILTVEQQNSSFDLSMVIQLVNVKATLDKYQTTLNDDDDVDISPDFENEEGDFDWKALVKELEYACSKAMFKSGRTVTIKAKDLLVRAIKVSEIIKSIDNDIIYDHPKDVFIGIMDNYNIKDLNNFCHDFGEESYLTFPSSVLDFDTDDIKWNWYAVTLYLEDAVAEATLRKINKSDILYKDKETEHRSGLSENFDLIAHKKLKNKVTKTSKRRPKI